MEVYHYFLTFHKPNEEIVTLIDNADNHVVAALIVFSFILDFGETGTELLRKLGHTQLPGSAALRQLADRGLGCRPHNGVRV